jgi:hypothetical protein
MSKKSSLVFDIAGWGGVASLGLQTLTTIPNNFDSLECVKIKNSILAKANALVNEIVAHPARITKIGFFWGSNGSHSQAGVALIYAYLLTKDVKYIKAAEEIADFLLGKNALSQSFFTYYGQKSVKKPHHRPSEGDGITAPIPGFIAGGINSGKQDNKNIYPYIPAAKSYIDAMESYASNEIAINWNGPATFLLAGLDAVLGDSAKYTCSPITAVNLPPSITISKPVANALIPQNDSISVSISGSDVDGIEKFEIYVDSKYVQTLSTKPYTIKFAHNLAIGKHTFTAVAFDKKNKVNEKALLFSIIAPTKIDAAAKRISNALSIYPNPINDSSILEFNSAKSGEVSFQCIDASGKITGNFSLETVEGKSYTLNLKTLNIPNKGIFNINVIQNGKIISSIKALQTN